MIAFGGDSHLLGGDPLLDWWGCLIALGGSLLGLLLAW